MRAPSPRSRPALLPTFVAALFLMGAFAPLASGEDSPEGAPETPDAQASEFKGNDVKRRFATTVEECKDCVPAHLGKSSSWHPLEKDVIRVTKGHELAIAFGDETGQGGLVLREDGNASADSMTPPNARWTLSTPIVASDVVGLGTGDVNLDGKEDVALATEDRIRILDQGKTPSGEIPAPAFDPSPLLYLDAARPRGADAPFDPKATTLADLSGGMNPASLSTFARSGPTGRGTEASPYAWAFDGLDDMIVAENAMGPDGEGPQRFTVSVWFRTGSAGGKIVGFESTTQSLGSPLRDRHFYINTNGALAFGICSLEENRCTTMAVPGKVTDDEWHNAIAVSSPNEGTKVYLDGALVAEDQIGGGAGYAGYWRIGGGELRGFPLVNRPHFRGEIASLRVYTETLDAAAVAQLASDRPGKPAVAVPQRDLAIHWDAATPTTRGLTEVSGNDLHVEVYTPTPYPQGTGTRFDPYAWRFNAGERDVDSFIVKAPGGAPLQPPRNFTLDAWFRTTVPGGKLVGFDGGLAGGSGPDRHLYLNETGHLFFGVCDTRALGCERTIASPSAVTDGRWHHVIATSSPEAGSRLLLDGAVVAESKDMAATGTLPGHWFIGGGRLDPFLPLGAPTAFRGDISAVRVYDHVLSAAGVTGAFGEVAGFPSVGNAPTEGRILHLDSTLSRVTGPYSRAAVVQNLAGGLPPYSGHLEFMEFSATDVASGEVGLRGSGTPRDPFALALAGDGSHLTTRKEFPSPGPDAVSYAVWVRADKPDGRIVSFESSSVGPSARADRLLHIDAQGRPVLAVWDPESTPAPVAIRAPYRVSDGTWHLLVATLGGRGSGDGMRLYVDGVLAAANAHEGRASFGGYWRFGGTGAPEGWETVGTGSLAGRIASLRVYDRVLSAEEVKALLGEPGAPAPTSPITDSTPRVPVGSLPAPALSYAGGEGFNAEKLTFTDLSGSGNPGTFSNEPLGLLSGSGTYADPYVLNFDGSGGKLRYSGRISWYPAGTVDTWFRAERGGKVVGFETETASSNRPNPLDLFIDTEGTLRVGYGYRVDAVAPNMADGAWHHVTLQYVDENVAVTLDGQTRTWLWGRGEVPWTAPAGAPYAGAAGHWVLGGGTLPVRAGVATDPQKNTIYGQIGPLRVYENAKGEDFAVAMGRDLRHVKDATDAPFPRSALVLEMTPADPIGHTIPQFTWGTSEVPDNNGTARGLDARGDPSSRFWYFDGAASRITTSKQMPAPGAFTFDTLFRTSDAQGALLSFERTPDGMNGTNGPILYVNATGHLVFGLRTAKGALATVATPRPLLDYEWHRAIATFNGTRMSLFVDGAAAVATRTVAKAASFEGYWRLGEGTIHPWPGAPHATGPGTYEYNEKRCEEWWQQPAQRREQFEYWDEWSKRTGHPTVGAHPHSWEATSCPYRKVALSAYRPFFNGGIAHATVVARALSAQEITEEFGSGAREPGTHPETLMERGSLLGLVPAGTPLHGPYVRAATTLANLVGQGGFVGVAVDASLPEAPPVPLVGDGTPSDPSGITFDGKDDVLLPTAPVTGNDLSGGYGLAVTFRTTGTKGKLIGIDSSRTGLSRGSPISLHVNAEGFLVFQSGAGVVTSAPLKVNDGRWHETLALENGGGTTLLVDGAPVGHFPGTVLNTITGGYWRIGNGAVDAAAAGTALEQAPFAGDIAAVRIYRGSIGFEDAVAALAVSERALATPAAPASTKAKFVAVSMGSIDDDASAELVVLTRKPGGAPDRADEMIVYALSEANAWEPLVRIPASSLYTEKYGAYLRSATVASFSPTHRANILLNGVADLPFAQVWDYYGGYFKAMRTFSWSEDFGGGPRTVDAKGVRVGNESVTKLFTLTDTVSATGAAWAFPVDVDGNGLEDVVVAVERTLPLSGKPGDGYNWSSTAHTDRYLRVFADALYRPNGPPAFAPLGDEVEGACDVGLPLGFAAGQLDSDTAEEFACVDVDGTVHVFEDKTAAHRELRTLASLLSARPLSMAAADLTQDGRDELHVLVMEGTGLAVKVYELDAKPPVEERERPSGNLWLERKHRAIRPLGTGAKAWLAPLDADGDGVVLEYLGCVAFGECPGHVLAITNPRPIAFLSAPPVVEGIGQDYGDTWFRLTEENCNEREKSIIWSVGGSVGTGGAVQHGMGMGAGIVVVLTTTVAEWSAAGTFSTSQEYTDSSGVCIHEGRTWVAHGSSHAMLFQQSPVDIYYYRIVSHPNPAMKEKGFEVKLRGKPATELWSVEDYNDAIQFYNENLPMLREVTKNPLLAPGEAVPPDFLKHGEKPTNVVGDPREYPTPGERDSLMRGANSTYDLAEFVTRSDYDFNTNQEFRNRILQQPPEMLVYRSPEMDVTRQEGYGSVLLGITKSEDRSFAWSVEGGFEGSVGVGPVEIAGSVSAGTAESYTLGFSSSRDFEAYVPSITDASLMKEHRYKWGLFVYPRQFGSSLISVMNYWVDEYKGSGPVGIVDDAPQPVTPAPGTETGPRPELKWTYVPNAVGWRLLVEDADGTKLNPFRREFDLGGREGAVHEPWHTLDEDLKPNAIYSWSVAGVDRIGTVGPWSDKSRFAVVLSPSEAPVLKRPLVLEGPQALLEWSPVRGYGTDNLGAPLHYEVMLSKQGDFRATVVDAQVDARKVQWEGAVEGGSYHARVRAVNAIGAGPWSEPVRFTVESTPGAPAPTLVPHPASGKRVLPVTWPPVQGALRYEAEWAPLGEAGIVEAAEGRAWMPASPLEPGIYSVRVRALNAVGAGPWSANLTFEVAPAPTTILTPAATLREGSAVAPLTWAASEEALWYEVEVAQSKDFQRPLGTYPVAGPRFDAVALAPGTYFVRARAASTGGAGPWSEGVLLEVVDPPMIAPTVTAARTGDRSVAPLGWDAVTRATGYDVQVADSPTFTVAVTHRTTATTWSPSGDQAPGTYHVRVRGTTVGGGGPWSAPVVFQVAGAPSASPLLSATVTQKHVANEKVETGINLTLHTFPLKWDPVPGATHYEVVFSSTSTFQSVTRELTTRNATWDGTDLAGGEYWVRVRAVNVTAAGPWSSPIAIGVEFQSIEATPGFPAVLALVGLLGVAVALARRDGRQR